MQRSRLTERALRCKYETEGRARLRGWEGGALGPEDQSVSVCLCVCLRESEGECPSPPSSSTPDASSRDVQ